MVYILIFCPFSLKKYPFYSFKTKHEAFEEYILPKKDDNAPRYVDLRGIVTLMKEHERRLGLTESEIFVEVGAFVEMILKQGRGVDTTTTTSGDSSVSGDTTSTGSAPDFNSTTLLNFNRQFPTATEGFLCPSCRRRLHDEVRSVV